MGMPTELKVYARLFSFFQTVGLMVEQDSKTAQPNCKIFHIGTVMCHPVIASDDVQSLVMGYRIPQQYYACIFKETSDIRQRCLPSDHLLAAAEVFVIAEDSIYGCLNATELLGIVALDDRAQTPVDDISTEEYHVGLLCINEVNPPCQFPLAVVVSYVQITCQDNGKWLLNMFVGCNRNFLAIFPMVMPTAQHNHPRYNTHDYQQPRGTVLQWFWPQMTQPCNIGKQEDNEQIKEYYQPHRAHLIEHG